MRLPESHSPGTEANTERQTNGRDRNTSLSGDELSRHEAAMRTAINSVFDSSEQNYNQFMQSFLFLTPSDVVQPVRPSASVLSRMRHRLRDQAALAQLTSDMTTMEVKSPSDDNGMEEEVLDAGMVNPGVMMSSAPPPNSLQVDNFVCEDVTDVWDGEEMTQYSPSFSNTVNSGASSVKAPNLTTLDISSRIAANLKPDSDEERLLDLVAADEDDDDAVDEDEDDEDDSVDDDEVEVVDAEAGARTVVTPQDNVDLVYNPAMDLPNPGEVEEDVEAPIQDRCHQRMLAFSATLASPPDGQLEVADPTTTAGDDNVHHFSLDDSFDYDNVVLSQKFTLQEKRMISVGKSETAT